MKIRRTKKMSSNKKDINKIIRENWDDPAVLKDLIGGLVDDIPTNSGSYLFVYIFGDKKAYILAEDACIAFVEICELESGKTIYTTEVK
jgi:hypothetical protein